MKIFELYQHFGCRKGWRLAISNNKTLLNRIMRNLKHKKSGIRYGIYFMRGS